MFQPVTLFGVTLPLMSFILIGVAIVFLIVVQGARTVVTNRLQELFASKHYDEFLDTVDDPLARFFIPVYNREYLRLNAYLAQEDTESASRSLDLLLAMRSTARQRDDLLSVAFQFYMKQERFKDAKAVLDEMKDTGRNEARVASYERTWEIFGNKSYAYLDQMEADFKDADTPTKISLALMISTQYANKKEPKKAEEWQQKVRDLLESDDLTA